MGRAFNRTFAQIGDDLRDTATFAFRESMIETATPDAYPFHLRNSNLQVIPGESPAATLAVLRSRWQIWRESGTVDSIVNALARLGYQGCTVTTQLDLFLAGNTGAFGGYQGFFFVTVPYPNGFGLPADWDQAGIQWDQVGAPAAPTGVPLEWDLEEPYPGAIGDIEAMIRKYKPATTSCRYLQIYLSPTQYVNVPMHEMWEFDRDGNAPSFYNETYASP